MKNNSNLALAIILCALSVLLSTAISRYMVSSEFSVLERQREADIRYVIYLDSVRQRQILGAYQQIYEIAELQKSANIESLKFREGILEMNQLRMRYEE